MNEWNCALIGSDDIWDQLSLTLRWVSCLLLPVPPRCSCRSAASLQSLISPCSRWKSYVASIPPSCPPLPNLFISKSDCTFLSLPLTPGPPSPFHNTSRPFLCQRCPICLLPFFFFLTQMSASCLPPHFSSFSPLKLNNLCLHITTVLVCFPR